MQGQSVLLPPKIVEAAHHFELCDPEELTAYSSAFPGEVAEYLGWRAVDVIAAANGLSRLLHLPDAPYRPQLSSNPPAEFIGMTAEELADWRHSNG